MIWWVLTYLDNYRPPLSLTVLAATNLGAHLFMKWSKFKPRRTPVYKRVRGVNVWCGYRYIWDTPNLVEQSQPGITFEHLFDVEGLHDTDHVWYYLFSIGETPYKECQGPLIHVFPPEEPLPSARVYHSVAQVCPTGVFTILTFDSYLWDNYRFHDPGDPTKLTMPIGALFAFGASARLVTGTAMRLSLSIRINASYDIAYHSHQCSATDFGGGRLSLHSIMAMRPGDFIQCRIYHTAGLDRNIESVAEYSPHFWVAQIGPYPISPPG